MSDAAPEPDAVFYRSPVEILLPDAIDLVAKAEDVVGSGPYIYDQELRARPFVRASILGFAIAIEGIANCCLERGAKLPHRVRDSALWFKTLDKLDLYLHLIGIHPLDRGRIEVQRIAELIGRVRNVYVHPAIEKQLAKVQRLNGSTTILHPDSGGTHDFLKIPESPRQWKAEHALTVMRAVFEFLDYFFVTCCGAKARTVGALLFDALDSDGAALPVSGPLYDSCVLLKNRWGLQPVCFAPIFSELRRRGIRFHGE